MPMFSSILKQISILCFLFVLTLSLEAAVFVKTRGSLYNAIDKLPSTLEYSSELEINGEPGTVSVYTLHDYNSIYRLAKNIGIDTELFSENGFRAKLDEKQGGGMLFAFFQEKEKVTLIHFLSSGDGTPMWLFPQLSTPSTVQFSILDESRNMRMCTYIDEGTVRLAIEKVSLELEKKGWERVTPGNSPTSLFFAKEDSIILVSAVELPKNQSGASVLIMEKK
jgi:hypothetical protein